MASDFRIDLLGSNGDLPAMNTWKKIDQQIEEAMYRLRTAQVRSHPKITTRKKLDQALRHVQRAIALEHSSQHRQGK
jgi:hypothetical protein